METNGSSTESSPLSRLGNVDPFECDALTDLFLGPLDHAEPEQERPAAALQLVVGCHLADAPMLIRAYCAHRASEAGHPIGCVHQDAGQWSADLIGLSHRIGGRRATISHAVAEVASHAEQVNVLLPEHSEVGTIIDGLDALSDPPDGIVVLATAIESDIVATYRQLKSIAAYCPEQLQHTSVVMVAANDAESEAALARLLTTVRRFLHADISGEVISLHAEARLHAVESRADDDSPFEVITPTPIAAPARVEVPNVPSSESRPVGQGLLTLFPELTPLALTCPDAPGVVFATDKSGCVHAFAATFDADAWSAVPDASAALQRAGSFIARHMPVLVQFVPGLDAAAAATSHLISDEYRTLAPHIDSATRVHLAVSVQTGQGRCWGASELRL